METITENKSRTTNRLMISNRLLQLGGYSNILIAIAHIIGLIWAEPFFEITGVGKEMKEMSTLHVSFPYLITVVTALFFLVFGLYGLAAAGKFRKLPYLKIAVYFIALIYILRGVLQLFTDELIKGEGIVLGTIYSLTALIIGIMYLTGAYYKFKNE